MKKIAIEEHITEDQFDRIEERLKDMDEAGVDMQVLSAIFPADGRIDAREVKAKAMATNDTLARIVEKYPERLASFAVVPLEYPDAAAAELERAVTQLGLKGTMVWADVKEGYFDDQNNWGIFETAVKLDVPIYIHMGGKIPGVMGEVVGALMGAVTCTKAMGLIFNGVFDKYPNLKIIIGHMGEAIPFWLWRIDNRWQKGKEQGTPISTGFGHELKKKPSQYFKDNFYITTSGVFSLPAFQCAYSVLGAERILFAADYPPESAVEAAQFIDSVPISDGDKEKVCHLNAEKLFRL